MICREEKIQMINVSSLLIFFQIIKDIDMSIPIIANMHISDSIMDDPEAMIIYILRHFTSIPSGIMDIYSDEEISAQKLVAQYAHAPQVFCNMVALSLNDVMKRYWPNDEVIINCSPEYNQGDLTNYSAVIEITATINNTPVYVERKLALTDTKQITIKEI